MVSVSYWWSFADTTTLMMSPVLPCSCCTGGSFANSLAIMTDAAHKLSDFTTVLISLLSLWLASKPKLSLKLTTYDTRVTASQQIYQLTH